MSGALPEGGKMSKMNRRKSRETAFFLLFEWSFHGDPFEALIQNAQSARELDADEFALQLCQRAIESAPELDGIIERYSESWKVNRLSKVTLTVLRLAFCEMTKMENIPLGATINEAVELCKKYASEDEAAFVNGILGRYGRRDQDADALQELETPTQTEEIS